MTPILRFILFNAFLITALNGCMASKQKELSIVGDDDFDHFASVTMLQPERYIQSGISDLNILSPQLMLGLSAKDVQEMFGVPNFKRYDPPAEIWQYRKDSCLLDFFLYVDKNPLKILRVIHVEARGRNITKISQKNCFLQVLRPKL